jgi:heptosyltransferase-2
MNVGVFLPNWIGDVVMATPALRALRGHVGPQGRLVGVMRPYVSQVLAGTGWLDAETFYDPKSSNAALHGRALAQRLRDERLDAVVLLTNSLRTGWLAWRSGAPRRIGFNYGPRGLLLTDKLRDASEHRTWYGARQRTPTSALDQYLTLVAALGCTATSKQVELATTTDDERVADRVWTKCALPVDRQVVVFNTGGAFGAAKLWPNESFAELARRIVTTSDCSVLMLCGPAEREAARDVVRRAAHPRVVSLADEPSSIGLSKACVRRSRLMVTTDSGPRHFAAAFDVPVVSLFGPTHIGWSENYQPRAIHLQKKLPCGPCQQRVCPLGTHQCMRDLTVAEVFCAVRKQLERTERRAA